MKSDSEWIKVGGVDPNCFACGFENEHGLKMKFESNGEKLRSFLEVPSHLRGWANFVHGGIVSTIIDETMSWSAIHLLNKLILTKDIKVEFKRPLIIETPVTIYGYVVEQQSERSAVMAAEIYDEKGVLYSRGRGSFALFTIEQFKKLDNVDNEQLSRMKKLFHKA